jgi:hypothetical protein
MKTKIEQRSVETTDHDYKDLEFEITIQPMRPLGSKGKSWTAFITRNGMPVAGMGEHYGHRRGGGAGCRQGDGSAGSTRRSLNTIRPACGRL